nr:hypothetical protein [Streptomyces sabulosicollis]
MLPLALLSFVSGMGFVWVVFSMTVAVLRAGTGLGLRGCLVALSCPLMLPTVGEH